MRTATTNNTDALLHIQELREVIDDSLRFGGGLQGETGYFFATVASRLQADVDYLANNLRSRELPVWGYEAFDDDVNTWAS